tara:strand:- start:207 stop:431 length:225 start_codon:yes stop_codon:yes gene_type:complete
MDSFFPILKKIYSTEIKMIGAKLCFEKRAKSPKKLPKKIKYGQLLFDTFASMRIAIEENTIPSIVCQPIGGKNR